MSKVAGAAKLLKSFAGKAKGAARAAGPKMKVGAGRAGGYVKKSFKEHPYLSSATAAGIGLPVAAWGSDLGQDAMDAMTGADDAERRRLMVADLLSGMNEGVANDRRQQLIKRNTMLLMQTDPQLAAQLMAGRRLPPGAAVFGMQPRKDLIEEVAAAMSNGEFTGDSGGDTLDGFLGG